MTLGSQFHRTRELKSIDRFLARRWVKVALFAAAFWLAWSSGPRTAHAGPRPQSEAFSN